MTRLEVGGGVLLLVYAAIRIALVAFFLGDDGVNLAVFAAVELGSAFPYGVTMARLGAAVARRQVRSALRLFAVAVPLFALPYIYIFASTDSAPTPVLRGVTVFMTVALIATIASVLGEARTGASARD